MGSLYALFLIGVPVIALLGTARTEKGKEVLLTRDDTAFLRGVSACFVIMAHISEWLYAYLPGMNPLFYRLMDQLGGMGVLVFFFVSGYGIYKSCAGKAASWAYVLKRAKAVYFPYLLTELCFVAFESVWMHAPQIDPLHMVSLLWGGDYWFISVILIQYTVFFALWKFFGEDRASTLGFLADLALAAAFYAARMNARWYNSLWLFTAGMAFARYEGRILRFLSQRLWTKVFACVLAFGFFGALFAVNKAGGGTTLTLLKPVSGAFLCLALCGVLQAFRFASRPMRFLGKRSLYCYIIHVHLWALLEGTPTLARAWLTIGLVVLFSELFYALSQKLFSSRRKAG